MDKTLQDLAWSILPKEFKEEAKKRYQFACKHCNLYSARGAADTLEQFFGIHNLTSDSEEEEMLMCEKRKVQELHSEYMRKRDAVPMGSNERIFLAGKIALLVNLFGSKCLPDNVESLDSNVDSLESEPAEPKFHVGQKVRFKGKDIGFEITAVEKWNDCHEYKYKLAGWKHFYREFDLEPYTEPKNEDSATLRVGSVIESRIASEESYLRNLSQETADCDKHFDTILKDSFSKERRLNIAAMAMQGILARIDDTPQIIAEVAFRHADALIAECKKSEGSA